MNRFIRAEYIYILTSVNVYVRIRISQEAMSMGFREDVRKVKALADENRLAIMLALQHGEKCGCVLLEELNITQPTLSHHMKILCDSGLVASRKEGKWMHYSLSPEGISSYREMISGYVRCDCEKEETPSACCCK